jgi:RNA polymerase sigma factor (sigma-70 family)
MSLDDPDLPLVRALQAGQDDALRILMDRHQRGIFRFIFRNIPNEADALELTQEVFVNAYFRIAQFRATAKFASWLYRIALNLCRDYARSRSYRDRSRTLSADLPVEGAEDRRKFISGQPGPDREAEDREKLFALEAAINELSSDLKEPLILTALEGFSQKQVAELLRISPKAVEMKVYRARKILLERMRRAGF